MLTNFELKQLKPKLDIVKKPENRVHELTDSNVSLSGREGGREGGRGGGGAKTRLVLSEPRTRLVNCWIRRALDLLPREAPPALRGSRSSPRSARLIQSTVNLTSDRASYQTKLKIRGDHLIKAFKIMAVILAWRSFFCAFENVLS